MNNRTQQRFDRSIRDALNVTQLEKQSRVRRDVRGAYVEPASQEMGRMVLLLDPETGGTVLVPLDHPLAAKRRQLRTSADSLRQPNASTRYQDGATLTNAHEEKTK